MKGDFFMTEKRRTIRKYKREGVVNLKKTENLTMNEMFEQFMFLKKSEGLAKRTIQEYYVHYDYFLKYSGGDLSSDEMTTEFFCGWISHMLHELELAPATVNIRVRTMRAFLRYIYEEKGWIKEPIHKRFKPVKAPIDNVEALTPDEVKRILAVIDDSTYTGFRLKVMIFVLLDTMARVGELVNMKRKNLDLKNGVIKLEAIDTKIKVERTVPLSPKTVKILNEYLRETEDFESEYIFVSYEGLPISESTVRENLSLHGKLAGITNKRVSPHTLRHTGALFYILNNGDPFSLQKILGHSHMNMVRVYIQMSNMDVQSKHRIHSPINYLFK
jgi:integrase/recombinase XerD